METEKYQKELEAAIIEGVDGKFILGGKVVENVLNDYHEAKLKESIKPNNPSAFPLMEQNPHTGLDLIDTGMTLRDYFAAKNISDLVRVETDNYRFLHSKEGIETCLLNAAATAYKIADAMLKEREK